jgi:DNA polymerase IV
LSADLARKGYLGKTIGVRLRYADFRGVTRATTLSAPVADAASIRQAARVCLKRVEFDRKLRLLGVRIGSLVPAGAVVEIELGEREPRRQGALFG